MSGLHGALGWLALAGAIALLGVTMAAPRAGAGPAARTLRLAADGLAVVAVLTTLAALMVGVLLLAAGVEPAGGAAHLALAFAALASLPVTLGVGWLVETDAWAARRPRWIAVGASALGLLALLLILTG